MNAERLLAHYDRIADAPDAIARLRRFILDLAVRGKLVPHDPKNERLVKTYLREPVSEELPENWRLLNFGKFCNIEGGNQPPKSQFIHEPRDGYIQLLQIRDLGERPVPTYIPIGSTNRFCKEGEILIGRYGASVGKVFWAQNGAYNVAIAKFIWPEDAFAATFAFLLLKSKYFQRPLANSTRSAQAGFNKGDLAAINFPLPPLAEQLRIVAKVDELTALCDRLEAVRAEREATRDKLTAASLARLNRPDPETFHDDARFALDALLALTTRRDQIRQLRQTIRNLAVRGNLVPQDPKNEPASELLKRIAAEKARLVKLGKIKRERNPKHVDPKVLLFEIKSGWVATTIETILIELQTGPFGSSLHQSDYQIGGVPVVNPASIQNERIVPIEKMAVGPSTLKRLSSFRLRGGDIVMGRRGEMGRCAVVTEHEVGWLCGTGSLILRFPSFVFGRFFVLLIGSPYVRDYLGGSAVGATMQNLNQGILLNLVVGLPPFAEQRRIVAKVDELMTLCDRLEASLATGEDIRRRLLDALLAQAAEPVEGDLEQAA